MKRKRNRPKGGWGLIQGKRAGKKEKRGRGALGGGCGTSSHKIGGDKVRGEKKKKKLTPEIDSR